MGRTIPSITRRLDVKLGQWERFARLLPKDEQEAFARMISLVRDRRSAIDEADEADLGVAMLLALAVNQEGRLKKELERECLCSNKHR